MDREGYVQKKWNIELYVDMIRSHFMVYILFESSVSKCQKTHGSSVT